MEIEHRQAVIKLNEEWKRKQMEEQRESDLEIQKLKQENIDLQKEVNLLRTQSSRNSQSGSDQNDSDHTASMIEIENLKLENCEQLQMLQ